MLKKPSAEWKDRTLVSNLYLNQRIRKGVKDEEEIERTATIGKGERQGS